MSTVLDRKESDTEIIQIIDSSSGPANSRNEPPQFLWSHLWQKPQVNPVNLKSYTLPILTLNNPYSRAFHLSWLSFFVAFLSWFAFPPLMPSAIKSDLKLTAEQVTNSNIVALASTMITRFIIGPFVDRYGPRKTMAAILLIGAIPSGLAGTADNASTLYVLRFFIGMLGASFVPCQAWTSVFFDKSCVGAANALVAGWGNLGGGATFAIMVSVYAALRTVLSEHIAWRAAFAIVPTPILIFVAILVLVFGQDHPAGDWSQRHSIGIDLISRPEDLEKSSADIRRSTISLKELDPVDIAINKELDAGVAVQLCLRPVTWLPALAYLTTFGLELTIDGQMATILFGLFDKRISDFDQTTAGYYTSIFGFLNIVTRPLGGFIGDMVYRRFGTSGKKFWALFCGLIMGISFLTGGVYLQDAESIDLSTMMGIFSIAAIMSELGNGATFALVPHCNANYNGFTTGLVGSLGNFGGILFALIFRFQAEAGKACWIIGIICITINLILIPLSV